MTQIIAILALVLLAFIAWVGYVHSKWARTDDEARREEWQKLSKELSDEIRNGGNLDRIRSLYLRMHYLEQQGLGW